MWCKNTRDEEIKQGSNRNISSIERLRKYSFSKAYFPLEGKGSTKCHKVTILRQLP